MGGRFHQTPMRRRPGESGNLALRGPELKTGHLQQVRPIRGGSFRDLRQRVLRDLQRKRCFGWSNFECLAQGGEGGLEFATQVRQAGGAHLVTQRLAAPSLWAVGGWQLFDEIAGATQLRVDRAGIDAAVAREVVDREFAQRQHGTAHLVFFGHVLGLVSAQNWHSSFSWQLNT